MYGLNQIPHLSSSPLIIPRVAPNAFLDGWRNSKVKETLKQFIRDGLLQSTQEKATHLFKELDTLFAHTMVTAEEAFSVLRKFISSSPTSIQRDETLRIEKRVQQIAHLLTDGRQIDSVIDIGSGSGAILSKLASTLHIEKKKAIGVDIVDRKQLPNNITALAYNNGKIPLKDRSISAATMLMVLHHCVDQESLFKEAFRVLRHGGTLIIRESDCSNESDRLFFAAADEIYYHTVHILPAMPVPCTFRSQKEWIAIAKAHGFELELLQKPEPQNPFRPIHLVFSKP